MLCNSFTRHIILSHPIFPFFSKIRLLFLIAFLIRTFWKLKQEMSSALVPSLLMVSIFKTK